MQEKLIQASIQKIQKENDAKMEQLAAYPNLLKAHQDVVLPMRQKNAKLKAEAADIKFHVDGTRRELRRKSI